jgi:hypothetical protein
MGARREYGQGEKGVRADYAFERTVKIRLRKTFDLELEPRL